MASGFVILDKPIGMTSRQAGGKVAKMFGTKKFGHVGTLDPMASGLLIIALGEATKMIPFLEERHSEKEYDFGIKWGIETDTGDITGKEVAVDSKKAPSILELKAILLTLIGKQMQLPPAFSAKKINGVKAYELARKGEEVNLKPSEITIFDLEIIDENIFNVKCSQGTYVRSLVQDISKKAGGIATCSMIRRISSNGCSIKNAVKLDFLEKLFNNGDAPLNDHLMSLDFGLADIPVTKLETKDAELFRNGGFINRQGNGLVRVYFDQIFIGIGIIEDDILKPKRIINADK